MCSQKNVDSCSLPMSTCAIRVFSSALEGEGIVKAMRVPDGKRISNSRLKPKGDISGAPSDDEGVCQHTL